MRKLVTLISVFALAVALSLAGTTSSIAGGKVPGVSVADITDQVVEHAASHFAGAPFFGDNINAGAVAKGSANLPGIGPVEVEASSSWDWGGYSGSQNAEVFPDEREAHPCALVNITPHTFTAANDSGTIGGGFITTDKVTITKSVGTPTDVIVSDIRGGYVCEIDSCEFVPAAGGNDDGICDGGEVCSTINEGVTAFEITSGLGKFASATGSGLLHTIVNFCTGAFELNRIILEFSR